MLGMVHGEEQIELAIIRFSVGVNTLHENLPDLKYLEKLNTKQAIVILIS